MADVAETPSARKKRRPEGSYSRLVALLKAPTTTSSNNPHPTPPQAATTSSNPHPMTPTAPTTSPNIDLPSTSELTDILDNVSDTQAHVCDICGVSFPDREDLRLHMAEFPELSEGEYIEVDLDESEENLDRVLHTVHPAHHSEYSKNWKSIRTQSFEPHHSDKDYVNHAYYRVRQSPHTHWPSVIETIFRRQTKRFKINYAHSFILHNKTTDEYRFWHASRGFGRVLDKPIVINKYEDLPKILKAVNEKDMWDWAWQFRPNSAWTVAGITSTTFFVDRLENFPIGAATTLPDFIMKNEAIAKLLKDGHNKPYNDNLCFFRALALHQGADIKV